MSELFAARQGRSAWEQALPLGQRTSQNLPFWTLLCLARWSSVVSGERLSDTCPPLGIAAPPGDRNTRCSVQLKGESRDHRKRLLPSTAGWKSDLERIIRSELFDP